MSPLTSATEHPLAAGHSLDAAQRFRLVLENAPAGSAPHTAGEEAMPIRAVAEVTRTHLVVATVSSEDAGAFRAPG